MRLPAGRLDEKLIAQYIDDEFLDDLYNTFINNGVEADCLLYQETIRTGRIFLKMAAYFAKHPEQATEAGFEKMRAKFEAEAEAAHQKMLDTQEEGGGKLEKLSLVSTPTIYLDD